MSTEPLDIDYFEVMLRANEHADFSRETLFLLLAELRQRRAKDAAVRELIEAAEIVRDYDGIPCHDGRRRFDRALDALKDFP